MEADYARKTDLTETQASLQSQISQNAAQITTTVNKVLEVDETANDAKEQADAAKAAASAAQSKADLAYADAVKAQTAADSAAQAATNAQSEAAAAQADLDTAKQNLANITSRVDATAEEIAEAQAAVETAQAAADKAKADAATAQSAADKAKADAATAQTLANNAQSAADAAQVAVDSLAVRVTEAETSIRQTSEEIELTASKVETVSAQSKKSVGDVKRYYCLDTEMPDKPTTYPPTSGLIETYTFNGNETVTWKGTTFEYASGVQECQMFGFLSKQRNNNSKTEFNTSPVLYSEVCTLYVVLGGESLDWSASTWGDLSIYVMGIAIKNDNAVMDDGTVFPKAGIWFTKAERDVSVSLPQPALIWDGDTTGRENIEGAAFKVTSEVPEGFSLVGQFVTFSQMGVSATAEITSDLVGDGFDGTGKMMVILLDGTPVVFVIYEDIDTGEGVVFTKGIYFLSMELEGSIINVTHLTGAGTASSAQTWTETEPTAETGKNLYSVLCTILHDGTFSYSDVSLSGALAVAEDVNNRLDSDYMTRTETEAKIKVESDRITSAVSRIDEQGTKISTVEQTAQGLSVALSEVQTDADNAQAKADSAASAANSAQSTANTANTKATNAAKTASNFLSYDSTNGLLVGNKSSGSWSGYRAQVKSDSFNILDANGAVKSSFGANTIELGKGDNNAVVKFCNGLGQINYDSNNNYTEFSADKVNIRSTNGNAGYVRLASEAKYVDGSLTEELSAGVSASGSYVGLSVSSTFRNSDGILEDGMYTYNGLTVSKDNVSIGENCEYIDMNAWTTSFRGDVGIMGDYYDNNGQVVRNGLAAYSGSGTSGINPDTTLEELILTNNNTPMGGSNFMYIRTMFYNAKSETASRAQIAIPYNNLGSMYHRYYYNGTWSDWRRHLNEKESSLSLSGSSTFINFHHGSASSYTSRIASAGSGILHFLGGTYGLSLNTNKGVMQPTTAGGISLGSQENPFYILRTQNAVSVVSVAEAKENIRPFEDALSEIEKTDVFNYHLKACLEREGSDKDHTGFVIGEGYNLSELLLSNDGKTIDLYNSIGVAFGGIKELHAIVKTQQEEIKLLKEQVEIMKKQLKVLTEGGE